MSISIHDWTPDSDPTIVAITRALVAADVHPDAIDARPDGIVYAGTIAIGEDGAADDGEVWWSAVDDSGHVVYEGTSLTDLADTVAHAI